MEFMPAFLPCTPMFLDNGMLLEAAKVAIQHNPANRPAMESAASTGIVLSPDHLAVMTTKWWGSKGVKLTVGFMESTPVDLQARLLSHMNAWSQYANVAFTLTQFDPQVRITRSGDGYWSYLGTDILSIPKNQPTMSLQGFSMSMPESEFRRVVRHETGHTLGAPHEHMRRQIIQRLDPDKTISYFRQTQGWSPAMTQQQVLTPLAESSIMATPDADQNSIMTYSLPGAITKDGKPIAGGVDIEEQDAAFIGTIYPKAPAPVQPPVAGSGLDLSMDFDKKTVSISLPSGWLVTKKGFSQEVFASASFTTSGAKMNPYELASIELEGCITSVPQDAALRAPGGLISKVFALIAALKAGDTDAILGSLIDLLTTLRGGTTGGGSISFQAQNAGIDWQKLIGVLVKLLPLLLS